MSDMVISLRVIELAVRQMVKGSSAFRRLPVVLLCVCSAIALHAQQDANLAEDTLDIRFRLDSIKIDLSYADNTAHWQSFVKNFESSYYRHTAGQTIIDIYAGASPEGSASHNRWLGEQRGEAVRRLLYDYFGDRVSRVIVHNEAARWNGLYRLVAASNEPWRDEVLNIIKMPASTDERQRDHRELKLRSLHDGKVWSILLDKYLAPLRSGATAIVRWDYVPDTIFIKGENSRDTIVIVKQNSTPCITADDVALAMKAQAAAEKRHRDSIFLASRHHEWAWALKTNLLLWGTGSPNIAVEIPLGRNNRWSVEGEFFGPWWTLNHNAYANEIVNVGAEIRYWLGKRQWHHLLDGWHIGLAAAVGYYDLEWKSKGYQGEHLNTYFNIGYQYRWGRQRRWLVDASIGVGMLATKYRRYYGSSIFPKNNTERYDDHLMFRYKGHLLWPGATHINISIGYLFNSSKSKH